MVYPELCDTGTAIPAMQECPLENLDFIKYFKKVDSCIMIVLEDVSGKAFD